MEYYHTVAVRSGIAPRLTHFKPSIPTIDPSMTMGWSLHLFIRSSFHFIVVPSCIWLWVRHPFSVEPIVAPLRHQSSRSAVKVGRSIFQSHYSQTAIHWYNKIRIHSFVHAFMHRCRSRAKESDSFNKKHGIRENMRNFFNSAVFVRLGETKQQSMQQFLLPYKINKPLVL